jgi:hypothetical protein
MSWTAVLGVTVAMNPEPNARKSKKPDAISHVGLLW